MSTKPTGARVLVAGAINTDLVVRVPHAPIAGETVTGNRFDIFGGGKGANQAVAAARSGATTAMLGALGNDDFGRERRTDLDADNIDCHSIAVADRVSSGVALITVEANGQNRISYVPGSTLTVTPQQAISAFERFLPDVVLMTLELPPDALGALIKIARSRGKLVVLNAAPEPAAGRALVGESDVLIVNEPETRELLDEDETFDDWARATERLKLLGPGVVVITLGEAGAVVNDGQSLAVLPAPKVAVVDTTGAGDAFCGVFAAHMAAGRDPVSAAKIGIAAGTLTVTRSGAQPSIPTWDELVAFVIELG